MRKSSTPRAPSSLRLLVALALLLSLTCVAVHGERPPIRVFTTADGLAHNGVNRIVRDSRGFLWFCTDDGLSRFDGYTFTSFGAAQGLPATSINDLLETSDGHYWIATDEGLVRFNPTGRAAPGVVYEPGAAGAVPMFAVIADATEGARRLAITVLREGHKGAVWVGTDDGLYRLEQRDGHASLRFIDLSMPHAFPEQRIVNDVLEDAHGSLWIGAASGLYRLWTDGRTDRYTERDGLPNAYVQDLFEDHEGQLWAGTRLGGFFRFHPTDARSAPLVDLHFTYRPGDRDGLPTSWVFQLFETSDRRFWIATGRGLIEFFRGASGRERFHPYAERNGLTDYNVTTLTEDPGGNLWMGTYGGGAMKLTRGGFTTYDQQDGIANVTAIFEDQSNHLCFRGSVLGDARTSAFEGARLDPLSPDPPTFYSRLGCLDGRQFNWFKPAAVSRIGWLEGWVGERVTLQSRNGEWWVATGEGLYRFLSGDFMQLRTARPVAVYTKQDGLATNQVFALFEDSASNIWISTIGADANGLARWEPATDRIVDLTHASGLPPFLQDRPRLFAEDRSGNVWIGFNHGLVRYAAGKFTLFTERDGLPHGQIKDIHVDGANRLWLASSRSGLVRVDIAVHPTFVSYTTTQGLSSNNIEVITDDARGRLYVGGSRGVDQLDPDTGQIRHFTTADGLPRGLFRAAFRDRGGALWFGTTGGLGRLAVVQETAHAPPTVTITGLRVSAVPQAVSALGERHRSLPDLALRENQLEIDFVGLGFEPGDVLRYQHMLKGSGVGWSAPGEQRTITYASLGPGNYEFVVRAMSTSGIVSPEPASITFRILPPLWLRWWFLSISALAIGFALYGGYRYRLARLLEIANLRTRIATDLHDDIGANLTRIALLSEVAVREQEPEQVQSRDGHLVSIAGIARESVSAMSDIVWAINPSRESLVDLTRRMRRYSEEVCTIRGIRLRFTASDSDDKRKLGVDVRRDLLLIFKEALNNAVRHSSCSSVDVDFRIEDGSLVLTVADDGVGFNASVEAEGQGLMSMRRRAQRLKGRLAIGSGPHGGTSVRVELHT